MINDTATTQPVASQNGTRDLFLSYNSRDREAVLCVRQLLHERNFSTFFDRDQLRAGARWVSLLEGGVGSARGVVVFIGPHGLGDWQEMEMQLALVRQINEKKAGRQFPVIPLILPGATPEKGIGFLELYTWIDLRKRLDEPAAIDELARAVRGDSVEQRFEATVELCPYRALQAFREQDEKLFFGRKRFADELLEKVRNEKLKLIAVVGASGSGKSSIVQAGLLPLLRRERPPQRSWEAAIFKPGKAPYHNLAAALVTVGTAEQDMWERLGKAEKLGKDLADGTIRLEAALSTTLAEAPGANRLLLVVDQAEEFFTLTTEQDRKPFIQRLLAAADVAPVTIVLTLRADFFSQAISFSRDLGELITQGQVNILSMSRDELCQAIVAPAESVGLKFEDGLVDRILDHIEDEPGHLPLLEFALTELWNLRQGKMLSNDAYKSLGSKDENGKEISGVESAISRRAEEQFNQLSREQQQVAQRVLTRLVRVAAASEEGTDTRQRLRLSELDASAREVIKAFADARLLVTNRIEVKNEETGEVRNEEVAEVAHEALIRNWQRLKELLNKDRQFLLWRQRLGLMLSEWQRTKRNEGALLRGALLDEAKRWIKDQEKDLNQPEREFIQQSELAARQPRRWMAATAALVMMAVLAFASWKYWDNRPESQINKSIRQSPGYVKADAAADIGSLSDNCIGWLQTLVLTGRSNEALDAVRQIEDADSRSQALVSIVEALANAGKTAEALDAARKIERADSRSQALVSIVKALANAGKTVEAQQTAEEALDTARKIENTVSRSEALRSVVDALANAGKTAEALDAARKIERADFRSQALVSIVKALANAGKTVEALDAARKIEHADSRSQALVSIVKALANAGKTVEAQQTVEEALDTARKIENTVSRSEALRSVVEALANAGKTAEALDAAREIEHADSRSQALVSIVEALANTGKTAEAQQTAEEALDTARKIKNTVSRSQALASIVKALANAGKTAEALDAARKIERADFRSQALVSIVKALANAGKTAEAQQTAEEALDTARKIEDAFLRSGTLVTVVLMLARGRETVGQAKSAIEAAQQAAEQITGEEPKAVILATVAIGLAKLHLYRQARELVDNHNTKAAHKLIAYTAILSEYHIEHHPEDAKLFDLLDWNKFN